MLAVRAYENRNVRRGGGPPSQFEQSLAVRPLIFRDVTEHQLPPLVPDARLKPQRRLGRPRRAVVLIPNQCHSVR